MSHCLLDMDFTRLELRVICSHLTVNKSGPILQPVNTGRTTLYGLLAQDYEVEEQSSPLMQGQAAVAARFALNQQAHQPDAMRHEYLEQK